MDFEFASLAQGELTEAIFGMTSSDAVEKWLEAAK
jgi:hypothetical protein